MSLSQMKRSCLLLLLARAAGRSPRQSFRLPQTHPLHALPAVLQSSNPMDLPLLEPVMASLTAAKRSGAAVRDASVDSVVDDVLRTSFTASIMSSLVVDAIIDDSQLL